MPIIYLLLAFTLNGVANIILKVSANRGLDLSVWNPATLVAKNYLFLLGLAIFAANVIFCSYADCTSCFLYLPKELKKKTSPSQGSVDHVALSLRSG